MSNKVAEVSSKLMDRAARSADSAIQAAGKQVRHGTTVASDKTIAYIHKEPVKSMLFAVAMGAALVALPHVVDRLVRSR